MAIVVIHSKETALNRPRMRHDDLSRMDLEISLPPTAIRGKGRSHALQIEVNRRFARGFMFNVSYTLLDQKSSGVDVGDSSLGGALYNQFNPNNDLSRDSFVSRHRLVSYGAYDIPFGRGRAYGTRYPNGRMRVLGGFQISWNMFAKSGTGFTPFWTLQQLRPGVSREYRQRFR